MTAVCVPQGLWDTKVVPEGVVSSWYYDEGAEVEKGAVLAVIMVEKTEYDIVAPVSGKLHIIADTDAIVVPGSQLASLQSDA